MKRTELKRKTPMKRTGFKIRFASSNSASMPVRARKPMKSTRPKMSPIRRAARGQECTIRIPGVCNFDSTTTVLCHDNRLASGKGMGLKVPDTAAAFGCSACHDVLDGRRPRPVDMTLEDVYVHFDRAVRETHEILATLALLEIMEAA